MTATSDAADSAHTHDTRTRTGGGAEPPRAFTATGPWDLNTADIEWVDRVAVLRDRARRRVPELTKPRRLPPGGRVVNVVGRIGTAVGGWWLRKRTTGYPTPAAARADLSRRLRLAFEALGPSYIKLGQIVSSGEGLFPAELVDEFKRCRDQVPAEPFEVVRATIESEFGVPMLELFEFVDPAPLAAASIAQVHRARLRTGEDVVVKVQRPDVSEQVARDLAAMAWLAPRLVGRIPVAGLANPPALVELFAETILEELDFRIEAANMLDVAEVIAQQGATSYVVPRPHPRLVTERVLVMQRLDGFKFDDVVGMRSAGIDTEQVIKDGMITFLEGALLHGVFHGDLHGGNLFVLDDGTTALLDFGIVARFSPLRRRAFLTMMMGAITNDVRTQVAALRDLGALPPDTDLDAVIADLGLDRPPVDPTTLSAEEMITEVQRVIKALIGYGARIPKELMLYTKNLVFFDGAIARLAPNLDLLALFQMIATEFVTSHGATIGRELGLDATDIEVDMNGVRAGFGLDETTTELTYAELQARRELIRRRMSGRRAL